MPHAPGDYLYPQEPRIDGAGPTAPVLQTVPTVPEMLGAVVPVIPSEPAQTTPPAVPEPEVLVPAEPVPQPTPGVETPLPTTEPEPDPEAPVLTDEVEIPGTLPGTDLDPSHVPNPVAPDAPALEQPETPDLIVRVGRLLEAVITGDDARAGGSAAVIADYQ